MADASADHLQRSIEEFVKNGFDAIELMSVEVGEDYERDDSEFLEITITFNSTPSEIARKEPPGFLSKLREHLVGLHEYAFPIVRLRSSSLQ